MLRTPNLVVLSLILPLLLGGSNFISFSSGQGKTTQQIPGLEPNQNASLVNSSQIPTNQSASNFSSACDSSYPDFCIPTNVTNLTCMDIIQRNFTVLNPDIHGLDSDGDGLGCENLNVINLNSNLTNKSSNLNATLPERLPPESINGSNVPKI
jgi:hypothetical protein